MKKTDLLRSMNVDQVKAKVLQLFSIRSFEYLKVNGTNLSVENNQLLNGDEVIASAIKRKGHTMYIKEKPITQVSLESTIEEVYVYSYI